MKSNQTLMRTRALIPAVSAAVAFFVACRSAPTHDAAAQSPRAPGPTIVRLVGRDVTITISAGDHRTLYSAKTNQNGRMLATNLTLDELRGRRPDVYRQVQPALCAEADARVPIPDRIWAGAGD